ncbi:MAG: hypothetical protein K6T83_14725 [Alicyclobacillus sp.]|nr:hypothetical protein [Alicyclobacillus sp.]
MQMMQRTHKTAVVVGLTLCFTCLASFTSFGSNANATLSHSDTSDPACGWRYVPLTPQFGSVVEIAGLADVDGKLQVIIRHDLVAGNSVQFTTTYRAAIWNERANTLSSLKGVAKPPAGYAGPIRLVFPSQFPAHFSTQSVKVERITKSGARVVVAWPKSIPLYGSAATPQTATPGSLDNRIIGMSGSWLWVALKGPQYPPLYPKQGPLLFSFRYWNRLVALNIKTGDYRLYQIPRTYTLYQSEWGLNPPSFVQIGSKVYVAVGSWIGVFPADPEVLATVPILVAPPEAMVTHEGAEALADMRMLRWQEINSLAAYWDSVMGKHVPGIPLYHNGQGPLSWNVDPVIFNHGALPTPLVWALEFPFAPGSPQDRERKQLGQSILNLLSSRLNGFASSPVMTSYATVRKAFGGRAPMPLPGYTIRNNIYWPKSPSILDFSAPPLPANFPSYAVVVQSLGNLLSTRSPVPVLFPQAVKGSSADELNPPRGSYLDIQYQINDGSVPDGYLLTVSIGPKAPANSPRLDPEHADLLYSTAGVPAGQPLPQSLRWSAQVSIPGGHAMRVNLGDGIIGTVWTGQYDGAKAQSVMWKQDGLTWIIPPSTWSSADPVSDARREVMQLAHMSFVSGATGYGMFGYGSDAPSEVVLHTYGATYALYATGWRAAQFASLMNWGAWAGGF